MLTERQQQYLDAVKKHGGINAAARALGVSHSAISRSIKAANKKISAAGHPLPHGQRLTKNTIQFDAQGNIEREWCRVVPEMDQLADIVAGLCEEVNGKATVPPCESPQHCAADILFELDIYDPHVGMYADERETLDGDYDCDIAAKRMVDAARSLLGRAGRPGTIVIVLGGDIMHCDNRNYTTERSNHVLDVDTRYQRVVSYVVAACTQVVQMAAAIAPRVEIVITPGNHDWHSCVWLTQVLRAYYACCDSVNVCSQHSPRKYMSFGSNLLVWTHGDGIAANKWPSIIAAENAPLWGVTRHRHLKMGHIHHKKTVAPVVIDEQPGLTVEYLAALCPSDAWHVGAGFVGSQKGASAFEYHAKHGLQTRYYYNC